MSAKNARFVHGSLMRHVIAMFGNAALAAAVGYAGAILFFTTSISIGLSIAAGALVSKSIGADRRGEAAEMASSVLIVGVVLALLTVAAVWMAIPWLLTVLGARGETHELAAQYLRTIVPSMPILMAAMVSIAVLRAHGDARRAMWATLIGASVNAALDRYLFLPSAGVCKVLRLPRSLHA